MRSCIRRATWAFGTGTIRRTSSTSSIGDERWSRSATRCESSARAACFTSSRRRRGFCPTPATPRISSCSSSAARTATSSAMGTSSMWSAICRGGRPLEASGPAVEDLEHSRYFLTEWMPPLLRETAERPAPRVLADLGAGDGGTLWPLDRAGLVGETIYAVDISAEHVALCERLSPKVQGIVSDAAQVDELPDASGDAVVPSQVIEHLADGPVLAPEIAR